MALTLAEANRMMQAAIAKAEELNVKLSVAVCDAGGNLLAFNPTATLECIAKICPCKMVVLQGPVTRVTSV